MSRTLPIPRVGSLHVPEGALTSGSVLTSTTSTRIHVSPSVEDAFFGRGDIVFEREGAEMTFQGDEDMKDTVYVRIPPWDLPEGLAVTEPDFEFAFVPDEAPIQLDDLDPRWGETADVFSLLAIETAVSTVSMIEGAPDHRRRGLCRSGVAAAFGGSARSRR